MMRRCALVFCFAILFLGYVAGATHAQAVALKKATFGVPRHRWKGNLCYHVACRCNTEKAPGKGGLQIHPKNYNYLYVDAYQIPKELDRPIWSEPYFGEGGGTIISSFSVSFYKVVNEKRQLAGIITESAITGKASWMTHVPIKSSGWSLAIVFPYDELVEDITRLNRVVLFPGITGIFLLSLAVIYISRSITGPLEKLARQRKR